MQFIKKTSVSRSNNIFKLMIKLILVFFIIFITIILLNKIDFPKPSKDIEKIISNEKLKVVK
mgnify:FL=1